MSTGVTGYYSVSFGDIQAFRRKVSSLFQDSENKQNEKELKIMQQAKLSLLPASARFFRGSFLDRKDQVSLQTTRRHKPQNFTLHSPHCNNFISDRVWFNLPRAFIATIYLLYPLVDISGLESREYGRRDQSRWPRGTLYLQRMALTSPTSGGSSDGIIRSRIQAREFGSY
jgi:hypothetical protein